MSRQSRIQAQKRNEFRQLQQVNRLYAQNLRSGMTPAQAATSQGTQQVTLTDGQSLDSVAQANGVGVTDILNANPDMTAPKTGMVINVPSNYNPAQRGRGFGQFSQTNGTKDDTFGGGLPSNAALGGTTNNPQGFNPGAQVNPWQGVTPGYNAQLKPNTPFQNSQTVAGGNPFSQYQYKPPTTGAYNVPGGLSSTQRSAVQTAAVTQPQISAPAIKNSVNAFAPTFRTKDDYLPTQIAALVNQEHYQPSEYELAYLEKYGKIVKTPEPAFAGGGGFRGRGGRGRGGGGGRGVGGRNTGGGQSERLPAFSSGGGFNGLINWRI